MNVSGNVMTKSHFADFYYLEALRAGMSMAKSANAELQFRRAFIKLEDDVNAAFDHLTKTMALRIWVYLWGTSLDESTYSQSLDLTIDELKGFGISQTFRYFPTEHNTQAVKDIFDQDGWSSAYGGQAWKQIVEGMEFYGKISDAAFIDHCVDLEHNGGCVFNKTDKQPFNLDCMRGWSGQRLHMFLDYKFSEDILNGNRRYSVSRKVYALITRYSNIVSKVACVDYLDQDLEWLTDFSIQWESGAEDREFTVVEGGGAGYRCEHCGDQVGRDYVIFVNDAPHCEDCVETCAHCDETVCKNDASYIDGEDETWCDDCKNEHAIECEECGKEYHYENTQSTDDDFTLCNDCYNNSLCELCDEHYYHMAEHDKEKHAEELEEKRIASIVNIPLPYDAEGVFEAIHEPIMTKTLFALHDESPELIDVYNVPNSALKIINVKEYKALKGEKVFHEWVIVAPCRLYMTVKIETFENVMEVAKKITPMTNWEYITTHESWSQVSSSAKQAILNTLNGG